jgi:hypothetical protein
MYFYINRQEHNEAAAGVGWYISHHSITSETSVGNQQAPTNTA